LRQEALPPAGSLPNSAAACGLASAWFSASWLAASASALRVWMPRAMVPAKSGIWTCGSMR
jgi:hypothetical protein